MEPLKRIPLGSGLGGGSSDAATVLLVLNRLWACGLETAELAELGTRLGADVPVFVHGRSALATGIGERLQPVELGERHYLLVFPGYSVSTGAVFADPGLKRDSKPVSPERALAGEGGNDCEEVVRRLHPGVDELLRSLRRAGDARLTGTGSTVFLPMADKSQAIATARSLKNLYNVRAVGGVDRSPLHDLLESGGE